MLTKGEFLLSDHYGKRIKRDLTTAGHRVRFCLIEMDSLSKGDPRLLDRQPKNQDSLLLIDVNGASL